MYILLKTFLKKAFESHKMKRTEALHQTRTGIETLNISMELLRDNPQNAEVILLYLKSVRRSLTALELALERSTPTRNLAAGVESVIQPQPEVVEIPPVAEPPITPSVAPR